MLGTRPGAGDTLVNKTVSPYLITNNIISI